MVSQQIDKIKQDYTDKYVVVDTEQPELARFSDLVGQVKTVNMNGRALVEFLDYHLNIGWFDIDLNYLKVVDKPAPKEKKPAAKKPVAKPAAKKPAEAAGEKKLSPLEMARQADGGGAKKPSTADILAAARGEAQGAAPAQPKAESQPSAKSEEPGKLDRSKMSVADMLAAARGEAAPEPAPAAEAPAAEPEPPPVATETPAAEPASADGVVGPVDKSSMSIEEMMAYCREKDGS